MKKFLSLFLCLIVLSALGCTKPEKLGGEKEESFPPDGTAAYSDAIVASKLSVTKEGKPYLEVGGKPMLMLGAQLRTDFFIQLDKHEVTDLDEYFKLAKTLNITVIQVPISWRDIEPRKNVYTSKFVDAMIGYCNKYGFKLEILWFGSYMCGYSVEGYIPDYVINDEVNYPSYKPSAAYNGWLGKHYWLKPDNELLIEREAKALEYMMNAVWEYDRMHGGRRTVAGIQVENEPDMLATRHNDVHGVSAEVIWEPLINLLDKLGQVVKASKYKCYTRVNLTLYGDYMERAAQIVASEGIDFVGIDPYQNQVSQIKNTIRDLALIEGNFAHIAENGGEYDNNDMLQLLAFTMGAGYEVFEVVTTGHEFLTDWTLRGVYNPDFTKKDHTQRLIDANKIFKNGYMDLALALNRNIVGFNLLTNSGMETAVEIKETDSVEIKWSTSARGIAYAAERDGYITVASSKADTMEFLSANVGECQRGYYSASGNFVAEENVSIKNNRLSLRATEVYRLKIKN